MADIGHNSAGAVDVTKLRGYVDRIERLEDEKSEISEQIKEVRAEAKAFGFNTKALNKALSLRKMEPEDREDLELYCTALGVFG